MLGQSSTAFCWRVDERSAHAPVNGGPVFPGTVLGYFGFVFSSKFKIRTPWCNDQNLIEPLSRERKMMARFSSLLTRNKRSRDGGYSLPKHSGSAHEYSVNDRDR